VKIRFQAFAFKWVNLIPLRFGARLTDRDREQVLERVKVGGLYNLNPLDP
jgi:hypothetical protein